MGKYYLVKIEFDTNDGDDVYGLMVINEEERAMLDKCKRKAFSLFDGNASHRLTSFVNVSEISASEADTLFRLGLNRFGEGRNLFYDIKRKIANWDGIDFDACDSDGDSENDLPWMDDEEE